MLGQRSLTAAGMHLLPISQSLPRVVTPTATRVPWLMTRPSTRTLWYIASQQTAMFTRERRRPEGGDCSVELPANPDTADFEIAKTLLPPPSNRRRSSRRFGIASTAAAQRLGAYEVYETARGRRR